MGTPYISNSEEKWVKQPKKSQIDYSETTTKEKRPKDSKKTEQQAKI